MRRNNSHSFFGQKPSLVLDQDRAPHVARHQDELASANSIPEALALLEKTLTRDEPLPAVNHEIEHSITPVTQPVDKTDMQLIQMGLKPGYDIVDFSENGRDEAKHISHNAGHTTTIEHPLDALNTEPLPEDLLASWGRLSNRALFNIAAAALSIDEDESFDSESQHKAKLG
jgi:hypothetical protein